MKMKRRNFLGMLRLAPIVAVMGKWFPARLGGKCDYVNLSQIPVEDFDAGKWVSYNFKFKVVPIRIHPADLSRWATEKMRKQGKFLDVYALGNGVFKIDGVAYQLDDRMPHAFLGCWDD
jgi:hypothetical protein